MMSISCAAHGFLKLEQGPSFNWGEVTFYHLFLAAATGNEETIEFGIPPEQGPRMNNGDRPCAHINYKGNISAKSVPAAVSMHDYGKGFVLPSRQVSGFWFVALQIGQSISLPDQTFPSGGLTKTFTNRKISLLGSLQDFWFEVTGKCVTKYKGQTTMTTSTAIRHHYVMPQATNAFKQQTRACTYTSYSGSVPTTTKRDISLLPEVGVNQFTDCNSIFNRVAMVGALLLAEKPVYPDSFSDQTRCDAVEACRVVKINTLALAHDLTNLASIAHWAKSLTKISSFRSAASSYLGFKYGAPLTTKDCLSLVRSLSATMKLKKWKGHSIARSRSSMTLGSSSIPGYQWVMKKTVKIVYDPIDALGSNIVRSLYDYGLAPSMMNLWDFIPFSFVLGWAVNVNDYLATIDSEEYLHTVNVRGVVESDRSSISIPGSAIDAGLEGTFELVLYDRVVSSTVALTSPSFQLSNPSNHLVEGGALILARRK